MKLRTLSLISVGILLFAIFTVSAIAQQDGGDQQIMDFSNQPLSQTVSNSTSCVVSIGEAFITSVSCDGQRSTQVLASTLMAGSNTNSAAFGALNLESSLISWFATQAQPSLRLVQVVELENERRLYFVANQ